MKPMLLFGTSLNLVAVLAMLALASPAFAQQQDAAPASQPAAGSQPAPAPPPVAASPAPSQPSDAPGTVSDNAGKSLKAVATSLHELSPWSMFMSADVIVRR